MKIRILASAVLAAALSASAFSSPSSAQQTTSAAGYWANRITVRSWNSLLETSQSRSITAGTTRGTVLSLLGSPARQLSPDLFVYDNCQPDQREAHNQGCTTLVVTFAADHVASLQFVNNSATTLLATSLREQADQNLGSNTAAGKAHDVAIPNK